MPEDQAKANGCAKSRATDSTEFAAVSITLTPEHARHVATDLVRWEVPGVEFQELPTRETLANIKAAIAQLEHRLDMVAWGESDEPVTLTMQRHEMQRLAERLIEGGADMVTNAASLNGLEGLARLREQRMLFGESLAGAAIFDQLAAQS
jgi:hypothetical protein